MTMGNLNADLPSGDPVEMISAMINDFSNQDGKSLRQIAHYSNVAYTYIHRLANKEISEGSLNPIKVFQVLKFIQGIEYAYAFSSQNEKWFKKVKSWIALPPELVSRSISLKDIENIVTETDESILAFTLACNHSGTTEEELIQVGGSLVLYAAKHLISKEILIEKDGKILSKHLSENTLAFFSFSRETCKRLLAILSKYYRPSNAGKKRNYIFAGTEKFTPEFIQELQGKISELKEWYSIQSKLEKNLGDNPTFFTMAMDTFSDKLNNKKELLQ